MSEPFEALLRELAAAPPLPTHDPYVGRRIGRYDVLSRLGSGAMGVVYRAHDPRLRRDVALKMLRQAAGSPYERLLAEARCAAAVRHPSVAAIYDVGTDGDDAYVAMEIVEGSLLADVAPMHWRDAVRVGIELADGLAAVHAAGLVHGDLKPDNVALDAAGRLSGMDRPASGGASRAYGSGAGREPSLRVKILDFGIAGASGEALDRGRGARGFAAPEEWRGERIDARADVYSLGKLLGAITTTPRPRALERLLARASHEDPAQRPADGAAMARELRRLSRPSRTRELVLGAVALALALPLIARCGATPATWQPVTQNSAEAMIVSVALAPDGARIAYTEPRGLFVADTAGGEPRVLWSERALTLGCVAYSPDGEQLLVGSSEGLHLVDVDSGATRAIPIGPACAVMVDARRAIASDARGVRWVELADGSGARILERRADEHTFALAVSPDGTELAYVTGTGPADMAVMRLELAACAEEPCTPREVLREPRLLQSLGTSALAYRADGALVVALAEAPSAPAELVVIDRDGELEQLARVPAGYALSDLGIARDGTIALLAMERSAHTYLAALGSVLGEPERVSLSVRDERPSSFSPDGRALWTVAETEGGRVCARIDLAEGIDRQPLGSAPCAWPVEAPDGSVLRWARDASGTHVLHWGERELLRVDDHAPPRRGGRPPPVDRLVRCAAGRCFLADLRRGRLLELSTTGALDIAAAVEAELGSFAVSRDASRAAIVGSEGRMVEIDLERGERSELSVPGCRLQYVEEHDEAWLVTAMCEGPAGYRLLRVEHERETQVLWQSDHAWMGHLVRSPDGARLAFARIEPSGVVLVRQ